MSKRKQAQVYPGGFVMLYRHYTNSPAYKDLKPPAKVLLLEFLEICFPQERNGRLSISVNNAAKKLNISKPTAIKAFTELVEHGFIVLTNGERWQERKAREWRLTVMPCNGRQPSNEWQLWSPEGSISDDSKKIHGSTFVPSLVKKPTQHWSKNVPRDENSSIQPMNNQ